MTASHRSALVAGAIVAVVLVVATVVRNTGNDTSGCRELPADVRAMLRALIPAEWQLGQAVYTTSAARVRSHDGAPVSFAAAIVLRPDSTPAGANPALWIVEGGIGREHERNPRGYFVYNDEAARITNAGYTLNEDGEIIGGRGRIPDSRTRTVNPIPPGEIEATVALGCLADRSQDQ